MLRASTAAENEENEKALVLNTARAVKTRGGGKGRKTCYRYLYSIERAEIKSAAKINDPEANSVYLILKVGTGKNFCPRYAPAAARALKYECISGIFSCSEYFFCFSKVETDGDVTTL